MGKPRIRVRCVDRSGWLVASASPVLTASLYSVHGAMICEERDVVLGIRVSRPSLFLVGGFAGTDEGLVEFGLLGAIAEALAALVLWILFLRLLPRHGGGCSDDIGKLVRSSVQELVAAGCSFRQRRWLRLRGGSKISTGQAVCWQADLLLLVCHGGQRQPVWRRRSTGDLPGRCSTRKRAPLPGGGPLLRSRKRRWRDVAPPGPRSVVYRLLPRSALRRRCRLASSDGGLAQKIPGTDLHFFVSSGCSVLCVETAVPLFSLDIFPRVWFGSVLV